MGNKVSQMGSTCGEDNLNKMAKNCMKITKSPFLGENSGGGGGEDEDREDMGGQGKTLSNIFGNILLGLDY